MSLFKNKTNHPDHPPLGLIATDKVDISILFKKLAEHNAIAEAVSRSPGKNSMIFKPVQNHHKPVLGAPTFIPQKSQHSSPQSSFRGSPHASMFNEGFKTLKSMDGSYGFRIKKQLHSLGGGDQHLMIKTFHTKSNSEARAITIKSIQKSFKTLNDQKFLNQTMNIRPPRSPGVNQHVTVNPVKHFEKTIPHYRRHNPKPTRELSAHAMDEFEKHYKVTLNALKLPKLLSLNE